MNTAASKGSRFYFIDFARGFIIVAMALDHAQAMISYAPHGGEAWSNSLPDYQGDGFAFLTRWITHLCAPGFFFLMGVSLALYHDAQRKIDTPLIDIQRHFWVRGLILLLLQFTVINLAWGLGALSDQSETNVISEVQDGSSLPWLYFGVLASLGASMLILSTLISISSLALFVGSTVIVVGSFILFPGTDQAAEHFPKWMRVLAVPGQSEFLMVRYPILPWLGVAGFGLLYGRMLRARTDTPQLGFYIGLALLLSFILMRFVFNWGDHHVLLFAEGKPDWIDYLNLTKYPPSLNYLALTIGLNLCILYCAERFDLASKKPLAFFSLFGSCTLFFYIAHLYVYAALSYLFPDRTSIAFAYVACLMGLILLYPMCLYWKSMKQQKPKSSWVHYI